MHCAECGRDLPAQSTGRPRRYCSRSCQGRAYRRRRDRGRVDPALAATPSEVRSRTIRDAAIVLADAEGIHAVTLRLVAHRCDLPLVQVQTAVRSRDRLVAMMAERIVGRYVRDRSPTRGAADTLTRLVEAQWRAYREHPWLVDVMASTRPPMVPAVLDASRIGTEAFMTTGLDAGTALQRYLALDAYVQGMAKLLSAEHQESGHSGTSYRDWWGRESRRLQRSGDARRHAGILDLGNRDGADAFDLDQTFREGLRHVVGGLLVGD